MDSSKKKRVLRRRSRKINILASRSKTGKGGVRTKNRVAQVNTKSRPKTAEQYFARGERFRTTWNLVTEVVAKMRGKGLSLTRAAREAGTSPRTVLRWGKFALKKNKSGRFVAKRTDRLLRVMMVPTTDGPREVAVRNSSQATLLSEYWAAVHKYLETGDANDLAKFDGKFIKDAGGSKIELLTDLNQLKRLGSAGVLSFHSIYAESH